MSSPEELGQSVWRKSMKTEPLIRQFTTGATRDTDTDKYDFDGFLSPLAIEAFGAYMHKHRKMADGSLRASDNWQRGIPAAELRKSLLRHTITAWTASRGYPTKEPLVDALCGVIFNAQGMLHELLKEKGTAAGGGEADGVERDVAGTAGQ